MICKYLDQSLLLLAHGALSPFARLYVGAHLRCCPHCEERYARLVAASVGIADELRGPHLPTWSPQPQPVWASLKPIVSGGTQITTRLTALLSLLVFLTVAAAAAKAYRWYNEPAYAPSYGAYSAYPATDMPPPPCEPDAASSAIFAKRGGLKQTPHSASISRRDVMKKDCPLPRIKEKKP
jgi:hypothetical protein